MGIPVLILGESGSGKSRSLKNFDIAEIGIFNVASKPLPFRKKLNKKDGATYHDIKKGLTKPRDWNEKALMGKKVGLIFQEKEWEYNGSNGFFTAPYSFKSVEVIRSGKFKIPKQKLLNKTSKPVSINPNEFEDIETDNDDLPF